jgi:hypothetical protein
MVGWSIKKRAVNPDNAGEYGNPDFPAPKIIPSVSGIIAKSLSDSLQASRPLIPHQK